MLELMVMSVENMVHNLKIQLTQFTGQQKVAKNII